MFIEALFVIFKMEANAVRMKNKEKENKPLILNIIQKHDSTNY
jgi:hypothetical protein